MLLNGNLAKCLKLNEREKKQVRFYSENPGDPLGRLLQASGNLLAMDHHDNRGTSQRIFLHPSNFPMNLLPLFGIIVTFIILLLSAKWFTLDIASFETKERKDAVCGYWAQHPLSKYLANYMA